MRKIKAFGGKLEITDKVKTIFEKQVTRFGNGAKVDCPKEFLGKKAYVIIRETE